MKTSTSALFTSILVLSSASLSYADFKKDVLPVFESSCGKCHMGGTAKGDLALDADKIADAIGASGAIVPKDAEGSELLKRIMMPEGTGTSDAAKGGRLGARDVKAIEEWIEAGVPSKGKESVAEKAAAPKAPEPLKGRMDQRQGPDHFRHLAAGGRGQGAAPADQRKHFPLSDRAAFPESQAKVKAFATPAVP